MFNFFKTREPQPNYRIRLVDMGYIAEARTRGVMGEWEVIDAEGTGAMWYSHAVVFPENYACEDEAEAGRRINKYVATYDADSKVVWTDT
jgi:hypothetical protein